MTPLNVGNSSTNRRTCICSRRTVFYVHSYCQVTGGHHMVTETDQFLQCYGKFRVL